MKIFITGGSGYIGSHIARSISLEGNEVFIIDNCFIQGGVQGIACDISLSSSADSLTQAFQGAPRDSVVIHLAAKKSVSESVLNPDLYEGNNLGSTQNLLTAMKDTGLDKLIFASTAAVYGNLNPLVDEYSQTHPISPYAVTKLREEALIKEAHNSWGLKFLIARYFNVSGAGWSDLVERNGENIFPKILQAVEQKTTFKIFGTDYPTPDGTCIRDYIHVMDLVEAHKIAIHAIQEESLGVINLGTSNGASVLELLEEFHRHLDFDVAAAPKRDGDIPSLLTKCDLARARLGWIAKRNIQQLVSSVI